MPLEAPRSALSGLVILCGGDDPRRIMTRQDLGRLSSIERTARLVAALLSGREITRQEATSVLGVQNAAADRQLEAIGRAFLALRCLRNTAARLPSRHREHGQLVDGIFRCLFWNARGDSSDALFRSTRLAQRLRRGGEHVGRHVLDQLHRGAHHFGARRCRMGSRRQPASRFSADCTQRVALIVRAGTRRVWPFTRPQVLIHVLNGLLRKVPGPPIWLFPPAISMTGATPL